MRFPYVPYQVAGATLYRPEVVIRVIGKTADTYFSALADTGSDEVLLPYHIGDAIGAKIDHRKKIEATGVAGQTVEVTMGQVEIEVASPPEIYRWSATVGFVYKLEVAIVGHHSFLDNFTAAFDGDRHDLRLVPTQTFLNRQGLDRPVYHV